MSNLHVMCECVSVIAYLQRMRDVWVIRGRREILRVHKVSRRSRRTTTYISVPLTYTKLTHNLFDVRQHIRQIFHTLPYAG